MRKLKEEYQVLADEFDEYAETYGCSCHINPPCSYCTHEGNPNNLEGIEEAWKEIPNEEIAEKDKLIKKLQADLLQAEIKISELEREVIQLNSQLLNYMSTQVNLTQMINGGYDG